MRDLLLVAAGGAVGAVCRQLTQILLARVDNSQPWGTLVVNVLGCFAIGALWPLLERLPPAVRPLVLVGFLGGLTTMSSYALEVVYMAQDGRLAAAVTYAVLAIVLCLAAVFAGWRLASGWGLAPPVS